MPFWVMGLSPHGRGKLSLRPLGFAVARSIPARAGETRVIWRGWSLFSVYPRTGGGNLRLFLFLVLVFGLSPHGRGKPLSGK